MRFRVFTLCLLLPLLGALPNWAQNADEDLPGYFPLEDILDRDQLTVEINLKGALLKLVAAATRGEEPGFAELIENLELVRVRVAELEDVETDKVRANIARTSGWLEDNDWQVIVRTRDEADETAIYSRTVDGEIAGLAILAFDESEVVLINIVGSIDWSQIAQLGEALDIPQLSDTRLPSETSKNNEDPKNSVDPGDEKEP